MEEAYEILIYHSSCPLNLQPGREERSRPWNQCKTVTGCHCKGYRERTPRAWVKTLKKGRLMRHFFMSNTLMFNQRRQWQPTPVALPGESQGWGSLVGRCLWGRTDSDTTEATQQQQGQHIDVQWLYWMLLWLFLKVNIRGFFDCCQILLRPPFVICLVRHLKREFWIVA